MHNITYMAVSFALVWGILVFYLAYLHIRVKRLNDRMETLENFTEN